MTGNILFIKCGSFSNINASLVFHLKKCFPNCSIEEFDVFDEVVPKHLKSWKNIFYLIMEYGFDFVTLRKSRYAIWEWAFVTSYMFKVFQREIQARVRKGDFVFTFQTQSLFDGSTPGTPHFVYTDSTVLAVLEYPKIRLRSVMKSRAWMKLEPQIYQNAALNFTFSSNQTRSLIEQYNINPEKVKCVYAGSNTDISDESLSARQYSGKTVLFVGVNWERKGGPVLLKAFHMVLKSHPDAKLLIVGCSRNLVLINNREDELGNCEITGRISLEEVKKYYLQATLFCMPTRLEPFGIVFLEAMMYKLPIISTNVGALPDLVEQGINGYLHDIDDAENIAKSIITLFNDEELCRRMGEAGHNKAKANYTWDNTANLISEHIRETIK